jgi:endonuclease I
VNGDRSNFVFGEIEGEERKYGGCYFEVAERITEQKNPSKKILHVLISICHINAR